MCGARFNVTIIVFLLVSLGHLAVTLTSVILAYCPGTRKNQFTTMWLGLFALVLDAQTWFVFYRTAMQSLLTPFTFIMYAFLVIALSLTITVCYALAHYSLPAIIAATWLVPACMMLLQTVVVAFNRTRSDEIMRQAAVLNAGSGEDDAESATHNGRHADRRICMRGRHHRCILNCFNFWAWSSLFFVCFFGFWLAFQGGFLAYDAVVFPPYGDIHEIQLATNYTNPITYRLHFACNKVPPAENISTFVFEADLGAFSTSSLSIMDELGASNRRACAYDRAGYGWSSVGDSRVTPFQMVDSLNALLVAANETGRVIMVGHGYGGRLAQLYAHLYPNNISGLALVNTFPSYLSLESPSEEEESRPNLRDDLLEPPAYDDNYQHTKSIYDLARLTSPLGWPRIYTGVRPDKDYLPDWARTMHTSKLGSNEEWDTRKKEFGKDGRAVDSVLSELSMPNKATHDGGSAKNYTGVQWPSLKDESTPVLLLPAAWAVDESAALGRYHMNVTKLYQQSLGKNTTIKSCTSSEERSDENARDVYNKGMKAMRYEWRAAACIAKELLQKFNDI